MDELPLSVAVAVWLRRYMGSRGIETAEAAEMIGLSHAAMADRMRRATGDESAAKFTLDQIDAMLAALGLSWPEVLPEILEIQQSGETFRPRRIREVKAEPVDLSKACQQPS